MRLRSLGMWAMLAVLVAAAGCEDDEGTPASVGGTWKGLREPNGNLERGVTLILTQNGPALNGTFMASPNSGGIGVGGTVEGNHLELSGSVVRFNLPMTEKLDLTVNGDTMTGEETIGFGNPGSETWNPPMALSLNRVAN
ncbi:MAG: hypothetical protein FJ225_08055 [Lentisphaerae bacterium]|nr:hypothetical protein [Lentisphaerota bacterium]